MADKFTDIITYVLSLSLAAGVIAFAAYKVVVLNGMENPPANLGLNFPAPKRKVIMAHRRVSDEYLAGWFQFQPVSQPAPKTVRVPARAKAVRS